MPVLGWALAGVAADFLLAVAVGRVLRLGAAAAIAADVRAQPPGKSSTAAT